MILPSEKSATDVAAQCFLNALTYRKLKNQSIPLSTPYAT